MIYLISTFDEPRVRRRQILSVAQATSMAALPTITLARSRNPANIACSSELLGLNFKKKIQITRQIIILKPTNAENNPKPSKTLKLSPLIWNRLAAEQRRGVHGTTWFMFVRHKMCGFSQFIC